MVQHGRPAVEPVGDKVLIDILDRGSTVINGIIIPDDDFKDRGIRPRKTAVVAVGPECTEVTAGDTVLVGYGDWTRGIDIPMEDGSVQKLWFTEESRIVLVFDR